MKKTAITIVAMMLIASAFSGCGSSKGGPSNPASGSTPASNFDTSRPITVVSREDGSGTRGAFIELFKIEEKKEDGTKTDHTTKEATIANKTDVMLQNVIGDKYAIGYVSLGSLSDTVKAVPIDGVAASAENVKNGSYKIARPFNIATKGEPSGLTKDFIDFIMSKEGQEVVAKSYIAIDDTTLAYAGTKPEGKIVIAGSSSVTPIMEKLVEAYKAINPAAAIEVQQSDSTAGMTAAIDGTCDIGMASRGLKDSEKDKLKSISIANDGIAVIVSTTNPLSGLTSEQVKAIFTGAVTEWDGITK
ncbi:substrate-binding domain-containing protein [Oscillospiraceae bacterium PP1C4]